MHSQDPDKNLYDKEQNCHWKTTLKMHKTFS